MGSRPRLWNCVGTIHRCYLAADAVDGPEELVEQVQSCCGLRPEVAVSATFHHA